MRSDKDYDGSLDGCLTVRPLQHVQVNKPSTKLNRHRVTTIKNEDNKGVRITIPHLGQAAVKSKSGRIQPYGMDRGSCESSRYYTTFTSNHLAEQGSPSGIMDSIIPLHHSYEQESSDVGQHSPGMGSFLPSHTSPPKSTLYGSDPASPMQTVYSNANEYPPEGSNDIGLLMPPSHPPPNYTEATTTRHHLHQGHLFNHMPPHYDSIVVGTEYPPHITAALPDHSSSMTN